MEFLGLQATLRERYSGSMIQMDVTVDGKRDRHSTRTKNRDDARQYAREYLKEIVRQKLDAGGSSGAGCQTVSGLIDAYLASGMDGLKSRTAANYRSSARILKAVIGDVEMEDVDQGVVDRFTKMRRKGGISVPTSDGRGKRVLGPVKARTVQKDCAVLRTICRWATRQKLDGEWLLDSDPFARVKLPPGEKNPARPIASQERFLTTLRFAHRIDPIGRFAMMLCLARYTGRRITPICGLRVGDLLLSTADMSAALAQSGWGHPVAAEAWCDGAIAWDAATDKRGVGWIAPLGPHLRSWIDAYLRSYPRMWGGVLKAPVPSAPLFPAEQDITKPVCRYLPSKWIVEAETLARNEGEDIPDLERGRWHPYRRLFRSERHHFRDKHVGAVAGWEHPESTRHAMNQGYLQDYHAVYEVAAYEPGADAASATLDRVA